MKVMNETSDIFPTLQIPDAARDAYGAGRAAMRGQQYETAVSQFSRVLAAPDLPGLFRARVLEHRAQCHWLLSAFAQAEDDYRMALEASDDPNQIARARVGLGEVTDFQGDYEQSEQIYQQALQEGTIVNNVMVIGRARRGLGILNRRGGNTGKALDHLTQALAAFRQAGEAREQARVLTSLGRTRHARGEYQYALNAHQEALKIFRSLGDRWRVVQTLNDLGECRQSLYDIPRALEYHQQALALAEEYGADLLKPEIIRNLGIDLIESGRYEEGLAHLQDALEGARSLNNREQEALALYNLGRAYLRRNRTELAAETAVMLDEVAEALDADRYRALAAMVRGELHFQLGERETAVAELNQAMLAAQTSMDRNGLWKLHATMSQVVEDEAIAAVHLNIAAEFLRQTAEPLQDPDLKSRFVNAAPVLAIFHEAGINPHTL